MLPQRHRLRRSADVQRVRKAGRRWQHPFIILLVIGQSQDSLSTSRFAISAGRRVGNAVVRNRVKRRLREIIRQQLNHIRPGFDLLLIAKTAAVTASYNDLERAINQLLMRAGVWTEIDQNHNAER